ncbi:MAG: RNA polymerase factor sigma-54 [Acidobacteria bacterium]|nr:RNA polymerase factor sigma-54 [Acidobacteriota bacterium]
MAFLEQRLNLKPTQKQVLTPSLVQMVSVLALNKLELAEMISQELMENPVLEEATEIADSNEDGPTGEERASDPADKEIIEITGSQNGEPEDPFEHIDFGSFFDDYLDPGYRTQVSGEVNERPSFENFLAEPTNLYDHLQWQLSLAVAPEPVRGAAASIIGNLNQDGYLTADLEEIAATGNHAAGEIAQALQLIQTFDPAGVGARDVQECLLIQLKHLPGDQTIPIEIVRDHLKRLQNKHYAEIARALAKPLELILSRIGIIQDLDPRPGQRYNKPETRIVEPDVFIVKGENGYSVTVNEDDLPQVRVSGRYRRMISRGGISKEGLDYVKERYSSALRFIRNVEQRKQTIIRVCESIVRRQVDFLDHGLDQLRPMMIKEVAEEVGVHPSTVSRAVADKFAQTPQGVYELRFFFSEGVQGPAGTLIPLTTARRRVKQLIQEEDPTRPLTDEQITQRLNGVGIMVTRRTVAKYREDLKILSTHQRRVRTNSLARPKSARANQ